MSESVIEFECPKLSPDSVGLTFKYDVISEDGTSYAYESKFKGLAYAGYADNEIIKDGEIREIDVPAQIVNDRALAPVRAVSESYGCDVEWDPDTKTVIITK